MCAAPLLQSPVTALGSLPSVALPSVQVQQITTYPLNGKTKRQKRRAIKALFIAISPKVN